MNRREFLKRLTLGTASLSAGLFSGCASGLKRAPKLNRSSKQELGNSRVSVVKGSDRRDMIFESNHEYMFVISTLGLIAVKFENSAIFYLVNHRFYMEPFLNHYIHCI